MILLQLFSYDFWTPLPQGYPSLTLEPPNHRREKVIEGGKRVRGHPRVQA